MTLYGWGNPRYFPRLPAPTVRYFDIEAGARVLAHCHWHPEPWAHPTLVALHGLNGSSDAHYMRGLAEKAFVRGMNVVRLNQRNCGNTEHLSTGLFHSGLTADARYVIEELSSVDGVRAIGVAGYSLGGNLALKLAGEYGRHPPSALRAVAAVSPILEIGECVRELEKPSNVLYQWNFVRDLKRRMRRKDKTHPGRFDLSGLSRIHTVRAFDEAYTAPHFGFLNADDYYHRASAMRVIDRIHVPALIIAAKDDPFVPSRTFASPSVAANPSVTMRLCEHGGHCGFVGLKTSDHDGYRAEATIVDFIEACTENRGRDEFEKQKFVPTPLSTVT
jgi:predicted alpha/beta-fold hydrolase